MAETTQQGEKKATEAATYHRDRLIAESDALFGQPSHVVVGALSAGRLATKVNFTTDEVEKAVKAYLDHEVEIDHPAEQED